MTEHLSTIISRLREAIDDPLAAVCTDHGGHRFPIPVSPETLAALLNVADVARMAAEAPDEIERAKRLSDVRRNLGYLNDLLPQVCSEEEVQ